MMNLSNRFNPSQPARRFASLFLLAAIVGCGGREMTTLETAEDLFGDGRFDEAITYIDTQLPTADTLDLKDHAKLLQLKGRSFFEKSVIAYNKQRREDQAKFLNEAHASLSDSIGVLDTAGARHLRCMVLEDLGREEEATKDFLAWRELDRNHAAARINTIDTTSIDPGFAHDQDANAKDQETGSAVVPDRPFRPREEPNYDAADAGDPDRDRVSPQPAAPTHAADALTNELDRTRRSRSVAGSATEEADRSPGNRSSESARAEDDARTAQDESQDDPSDEERTGEGGGTEQEVPKRLTEETIRRMPGSPYGIDGLPGQQLGSFRPSVPTNIGPTNIGPTTGRLHDTTGSVGVGSPLGSLGAAPSTGLTGPTSVGPSPSALGNATGIGATAVPNTDTGYTGYAPSTGIGATPFTNQRSGLGGNAWGPAAGFPQAGPSGFDTEFVPPGGLSPQGMGVGRPVQGIPGVGVNSSIPLSGFSPNGLPNSPLLGPASGGGPVATGPLNGLGPSGEPPTSVLPKVTNFGGSLPRNFAPKPAQPKPQY